MTYKMFDTAQGQFCIDWDTCCHIIRSYHRSRLQLDYSKEQRESQVSIINPLSWEMPDLIMLTVDWDKVRSEATTAVLNSAHGLAFRAVFQKDGIDAMVRELQMMQRKTKANNEAFQEKQRDVSRKASKEIEAAVASYGTALTVAKTVRDVSASILVGIGTVVSGGTAALGIGAGAALKGTAKYQDSEKNGEGVALIEVTQTVVTNAIPMGKGVKLIINTAGDTGKALVEGKSVWTAIGVGAVNVITAPLGDKAKSTLGDIFDKTAVSAVVKVGQDQAKSAAQRQVKELGKSSESSSPAFGGASPLMDSIAFEDSFLLKLAVIDMSQGIGRSWW
jgi:hypothetical protein